MPDTPNLPNLLQRILRADYPERVSAMALLIGCASLGAAVVILALAGYGGKEVGGQQAAACTALGVLIGYAYGKAKVTETTP